VVSTPRRVLPGAIQIGGVAIGERPEDGGFGIGDDGVHRAEPRGQRRLRSSRR
jgi:hypothetical protein